jgi:hypothetical protein
MSKANCKRLRAEGWELRAGSWGLRAGSWGLRAGGWGLGALYVMLSAREADGAFWPYLTTT